MGFGCHHPHSSLKMPPETLMTKQEIQDQFLFSQYYTLLIGNFFSSENSIS